MKKTRLSSSPTRVGWMKILRIMKLTIFLILFFIFDASASLSQNSRISLNIENGTLREIFGQIEEQTDFRFFYQNEQLSDIGRKTIDVSNMKLEAILDVLLTDTGISYQIVDKNIILFPKSDENSNTNAPIQQVKTITGKVTDTKSQPLPGVTILIKGTSQGTITDPNGDFELSNVPDDATLVFSFIGMKSKEVAVSGRTSISVTMEDATIGLDEIVAIGYGSMKKSDLTGSVSSVKADMLKDLPVKSVSEALQGKAAGVFVTKGTGAPGASSDIIIRGAGSINGLSPLYIVDGVRMGTDKSFNMSDVQSIEVLKDASSAAIYGVEAAGGVILVTTKKGSKGEKAHVEFNAYYGMRSAVNLPKLLDSKDYIKARKVMGVEYASWENNPYNTDWMDEMYSPAPEQKYDLSISGGNKVSTYYISAGYLREDGIRRDNWFERYSFRMNSDHKLSKNLKMGEYLYIHKTKDRPTGDGSGLPYRSIPLMPVYDASRVGGWAAVPDGFQGGNPVGFAESYIYNNNGWGMEGNVYADWSIIKGLNLRSTVGGYMGGIDNSQFNLRYDYGILKNGVRKLEKNLSRNETITAHLVLTFDRTFGKHGVKAMAGWEAIKGTSSNVDASTEGFPVYYMPSFATSTQNSTSRYADGNYGRGSQLAQFGRLNYNYAGKYLFQGTVRRDGTNKFIGDNQYGVFPSFSGAWRLSEENFMKGKFEWLSNLKLRAGWGVLGSIGSVGDFIYQSTYKPINVYSYDGVNTVTGWGNAKFANSDIRWEKVTTKDVGLDLGLLRNRLSFTVDVYDKETTDMIYTVALPVSSGLGNYNGDGFGATINIGKISNRGFEIEANWNDKIGDFSYSVGGNASFNKNKVIQIGDKGALIYEGGTFYLNSSISRTEDGYPMGQFYGYIADGIFQTDAEAAQSAQPDARSGDLIYRDINGRDANGNLTGKPDGKIDDADKTYIGNPWPKCYYGINMSFSYKGFDLKAFFQGQAGVDLFNSTKSIRESFYADWNTTSEIFNTSKFGNTTITNLPSVYQVSNTGEILRDPNGNYKNVSSFFVENGAYIKLQDLQLGYTLPTSLSNRIGLGSARIYIAGSNLFTITKYTGLDPELGGNVKGRGIETDGLYPQTRFVSAGLNLKF
jgi:TonB-dependent starch-binding outer membrane protein SusC